MQEARVPYSKNIAGILSNTLRIASRASWLKDSRGAGWLSESGRRRHSQEKAGGMARRKRDWMMGHQCCESTFSRCNMLSRRLFGWQSSQADTNPSNKALFISCGRNWRSKQIFASSLHAAGNNRQCVLPVRRCRHMGVRGYGLLQVVS
jgi:hypothetical protein